MYVEYYCDNGDTGTTGSHNLYRRIMAFNAAPAETGRDELSDPAQ